MVCEVNQRLCKAPFESQLTKGNLECCIPASAVAYGLASLTVLIRVARTSKSFRDPCEKSL